MHTYLHTRCIHAYTLGAYTLGAYTLGAYMPVHWTFKLTLFSVMAGKSINMFTLLVLRAKVDALEP